MSHINEALKKAQTERDIHYYSFGSLLSRSRMVKKTGLRKGLPYFLSPLILIFIIFVFYSRLNEPSSGKDNAIEPQFPVQMKQSDMKADFKNLYSRANDYFKNGRFQEAKRLYEELIDSDPGYIDALNNLGVIYMRDKDYPMAKRNLEKAVRLNPFHAEPYYNLACLYAINGDVGQGIIYLERAISLDHNVRNWAMNDTDLVNLHDLPEFIKMVEYPQPRPEEGYR
jgi:tetratricopeptide (TPR) repeat protein